jgi:hypothetical protein
MVPEREKKNAKLCYLILFDQFAHLRKNGQKRESEQSGRHVSCCGQRKAST